MYLLSSSILPCSSSPIYVDATALCEAALSLKMLDLRVVNSTTHEALAGIFDLQPLEELVLCLYFDDEVSSACSPGMPFVSVQARPIALFDLLSTQLVYSDPHNKCMNAPSYSLLLSLYVMCAAGG